MKRKRALIFFLSIVAFLFSVYLLLNRRQFSNGYLAAQTNTPSATNGLTQQLSLGTNNQSGGASQNPSVEERLRRLEQLGNVPEGADILDWQLAQKASWWGKPLAAKDFWKDRVVWLDASAKLEARRRGRGYPPLPYQDTSLPQYPDDEGLSRSTADIEGPNLHFVTSSKETAFWGKFFKTQPKPPDVMGTEQENLAANILDLKNRQIQPGNNKKTTTQNYSQIERVYKTRALDMGFPEEMLDDEALFWSYIFKERQAHQKLVEEGHSSDSMRMKFFLGELLVDSKLILGQLTDDQFKSANNWKVTYLQRLRREKVDESYINAYLKAWNLTAEKVFTKP